jgi:O-acetyl-ADP-ribose deacetylase (regulator of RNase III)
MPLLFKRGDILSVDCDAIVVPINNSMTFNRCRDSGVFSKVCSLANSDLEKELIKSGGCETGKAKILPSFGLDFKHLIFTASPKWREGEYGEVEFLRSCYKESFELAKNNCCESIAFPLISSGHYGMDKALAIEIAISELKSLVADSDLTVYLTFYDDEANLVGEKHITKRLSNKISGLRKEITQVYDIEKISDESFKLCEKESLDIGADENLEDIYDILMPPINASPTKKVRKPKWSSQEYSSKEPKLSVCASFQLYKKPPTVPKESLIDKDLQNKLRVLDESFSDMIIRKLNEKNMKSSDCYKRANVTKQLFSKIISNANYKTTKPTALAFAVALQLDINETEELLRKAGYALSGSYDFDVIVEYFIKRKEYDVFLINEVLFQYDQPLLGSR